MAEIRNPLEVEAETEGRIPAWLKGSLVRNGPGLLKFGEETVKSLADGFPMVRKYQLDQSKMNLTRRLLDSETLQANIAANRIVTMGMNTYPTDFGIKDCFMTLIDGHLAETANVATIQLFGR